jgi:predicted MPP superfamily phosphohydrolase
VTDVPAEGLRIRPEQLASALAEAAVAAIVFGGDLTGRQFKPERALPWLDAIRKAAQFSGSPLPCYAVIGNHDSQRSIDLLAAYGFEILKNQAASLTDSRGRDWLLCGLDILKKGEPDLARALSRLSPAQGMIPPTQRIVLAHNPDTLLTVPPQTAAFFLAGHFHGGQIYLPFHLEFLLLRREKIGRMGYHKGSFEHHGLSCYISRGLGSVLFPLRLKSKPELPLIELLPVEQLSLRNPIPEGEP